MEGPPLGPGGEDITWPDQVAPRGRKASSTRKIKPQTSNPFVLPEGRLNSVLVDYLSQNNLGELLRLAETLASKTKARDSTLPLPA